MAPDEFARIKAAAEARADEATAQGVRDLEAKLEHAEEWVLSGFEGRAHFIIAERQMTAGMLAHIKQAWAKNHAVDANTDH